VAEEYVKGQKVVRWLDILMILAAAPRGMKASELAARTGLSRRTLERDMAAIEQLKQLKVHKDGPRWMLMEGATLRPVAFEAAEAVELLMACRLAVRHADYNDRVLGMALAKVNGVMPRDAQLVRRFVQETADELTGKADADERALHLRGLVRAWIESRKVEIDYTDAQLKASTRVVHPYCLEPASAAGHGTYLVAKDELSSEVRSFKIERIQRVTLLDSQYRLPPDFSLAKYLRDSWGIWSNDTPQDVVLRFWPPAARRAAESNWHPSQRIRELDDGVVELTVRVRGTVEITPWILGWGPDVEVLSPLELRSRVSELAGATADRYASTEREKPPA
jgi:predicted DNA-binding transcriptional regulator YafY